MLGYAVVEERCYYVAVGLHYCVAALAARYVEVRQVLHRLYAKVPAPPDAETLMALDV